MADRPQFDEPPPLPREPTAINVPDAMRNPPVSDAAHLPSASDPLPPPPKFPSLTDVALPSATVAADAAGFPQHHPHVHHTPPVEETPVVSTTAPVQPALVQPAPVQPALVQPAHLASTHLPAETGHDIEDAIQRASVPQGTGARKAFEAGQRIWTTSDQQELDRLLQEGRDVYVPPDVESRDLPVRPASDYAYVPMPPSDSRQAAGASAADSVTLPSSERPESVAHRIAVWNQVVVEEDRPSSSRPSSAAVIATGATAAAATGAGAVVGSAVSSQHPSAVDAAKDVAASRDLSSAPPYMPEQHPVERVREAQPVDQASRDLAASHSAPGAEAATAASASDALEPSADDAAAPDKAAATTTRNSADVTRSIFGGSFYTVPVKSMHPGDQLDDTTHAADVGDSSYVGASTEDTRDGDDVATTEVMLRSDASANIDIKEDYGLKGGHSIGCNDAVFLDDHTLATCGADGKVCIWNMHDRAVSLEFVPFDGESVTMIYPMGSDHDEAVDDHSYTIMTLSKTRLMRIWTVDQKQAVMLRSTQIQTSDKDLYMSVPIISKELKSRAAAAAAAAAVTTTDAPEVPAELGTATGATETTSGPTAIPAVPLTTSAGQTTDSATAASAADTAPVAAQEEKEGEKDRKNFFTKVLSFGRSGSRKAVAS